MLKSQPKWARFQYTGEFILIITCSGLGISRFDHSGKEFIFPISATDDELGRATLAALEASRIVDSNDADFFDYRAYTPIYQQWLRKLMSQFGYGSKRAMFKDMKDISINLWDGLITISPSHHEKLDSWSGKGLTEADKVKLPASSSPEEIGAGLRLALRRCT